MSKNLLKSIKFSGENLIPLNAFVFPSFLMEKNNLTLVGKLVYDFPTKLSKKSKRINRQTFLLLIRVS
jgi:hypothetical protein